MGRTGEASPSCPAPPRGCCQKMTLAPPPPSTCSDKGGRGAFNKYLPPSSQCSSEKLKKNPHTPTNFLLNLSYFTKNYVIQLCMLAFFTLILACDAKEVFTNQFYVKLDPTHGHSNPEVLAHAIAKRNGFHSLGPVLGSWSQLRASLDQDDVDPAVVHPEDHYQKLEAMAESKEKRGYNSLKVENMVSLPPPTDPSDPLFPRETHYLTLKT